MRVSLCPIFCPLRLGRRTVATGRGTAPICCMHNAYLLEPCTHRIPPSETEYAKRHGVPRVGRIAQGICVRDRALMDHIAHHLQLRSCGRETAQLLMPICSTCFAGGRRGAVCPPASTLPFVKRPPRGYCGPKRSRPLPYDGMEVEEFILHAMTGAWRERRLFAPGGRRWLASGGTPASQCSNADWR